MYIHVANTMKVSVSLHCVIGDTFQKQETEFNANCIAPVNAFFAAPPCSSSRWSHTSVFSDDNTYYVNIA